MRDTHRGVSTATGRVAAATAWVLFPFALTHLCWKKNPSKIHHIYTATLIWIFDGFFYTQAYGGHLPFRDMDKSAAEECLVPRTLIWVVRPMLCMGLNKSAWYLAP